MLVLLPKRNESEGKQNRQTKAHSVLYLTWQDFSARELTQEQEEGRSEGGKKWMCITPLAMTFQWDIWLLHVIYYLKRRFVNEYISKPSDFMLKGNLRKNFSLDSISSWSSFTFRTLTNELHMHKTKAKVSAAQAIVVKRTWTNRNL